ncbi:hypothetical protein QR680_009929 [Steinernema hermaphroditum]|uniref:Uncharacterized protein n=1 Tax=Steinernema hermaphroditum TaxID=289476 RepID=A0AA39MAU4_9BILA|nr:hypothetical protein QR680_009929 [Steinernema hermaphroditum]
MKIKDLVKPMAIFKIVSAPLFIPPYLLLLWVFATKQEFRNFLAYKIILSIGVMDCLFLLQNLYAGIFTLIYSKQTVICLLYKQDYLRYPEGLDCSSVKIGEVMSCMRSGYLQAAPFLSFLLALNRLHIMLNVRGEAAFDVLCKAGLVVGWFISFPLMLILQYFVNTRDDANEIRDIVFDMHLNGYTYDGPPIFGQLMGYFGPAMESGVLALTLAVVGVIIIQVQLT